LPKTTISYDQFLTDYRQDRVGTNDLQNSGFQPVNGTPADLGIICSTMGPAKVPRRAAPVATPLNKMASVPFTTHPG
jgi:hypothetical protein